MADLNCIFSEPINLGNEELPDFEFSQINCTNIQTELIQNASTGAEFYLRKDISYGDFLILTLLLFCFIFGIVKIFGDAFIPKRVDFHR